MKAWRSFLIISSFLCVLVVWNYQDSIRTITNSSSSSSRLSRLRPTHHLGRCRSIDFVSSSLPQKSSMDQTGGVLLFYHIAKTGGTSIRQALLSDDSIRYGKGLTLPIQAQMEQILSGGRQKNKNNNHRKILFVELHGNSPNLAQLSSQLNHWHELSRKHNIPFWAFTILRNPIDIQVSSFLFFKRNRHHNCTRLESCEALLLNSSSTLIPNRQCRVLARGQGKHKIMTTTLQNATTAECQMVQEKLCHDWNFVGTTETMDTVTMPLLQYILHGTSTIATTKDSSSSLTTTTSETNTNYHVHHANVHPYNDEIAKVFMRTPPPPPPQDSNQDDSQKYNNNNNKYMYHLTNATRQILLEQYSWMDQPLYDMFSSINTTQLISTTVVFGN